MTTDDTHGDGVSFSGRLEKSDYLRAISLYRRPGRLAMASYAAFFGILIIAAIVAILSGDSAGWRLAGGLVVVVLLVWVLPLGIASMNWKSHKLIREPYEGAASSTGVRWKSAYGESNVPWDAFFGSKDSSSLVLLFQSRQLMHMFPRHFFASDADWEAFRGLVRAKAPRIRNRARQWRMLLYIAIVVVAVLLILVRVFAR